MSNFITGIALFVTKTLHAGECLAGALYWKSFVDLSKEIGFSGPYLVTSRNMACGNEELQKVLGMF